MQTEEVLMDTQLLQVLEGKLSNLAALWRGRKDEPEAAEIVRQYHAVLQCMLQLGFRGFLDVDSELPDRLMPQEYLQLYS